MPEVMENIGLNESNGVEGSNSATYLTFVSDGLHFGVHTDKVVEIINNHNIRPFPMVPDYVRGVINLRGQVIPIIDMRLRVGKPYQEITAETCIIVLEIGSDIIGIVVDSVAHVTDIDMNQATLIPTENRLELTRYMVTDENGTVIMLLECEALIADNIAM